eukprot:11205670-Lingulodinium_polyedra.AAC.1
MRLGPAARWASRGPRGASQSWAVTLAPVWFPIATGGRGGGRGRGATGGPAPWLAPRWPRA